MTLPKKTHNGKNRHATFFIVIVNGRPDKQGFYTFTLSLSRTLSCFLIFFFLQKSYIDDEDIFFSFFNIFALDDSAQYLELDNSAHH